MEQEAHEVRHDFFREEDDDGVPSWLSEGEVGGWRADDEDDPADEVEPWCW